MAETPADKREANERIPKKGGKLDQYKWWLIGGLGLVAVLVFVFVGKSNSNAAQSGQSTQPGIDPNTGVPYSMEYGDYGAGAYGGGFFGGGGGTPGPAGTPGARGPRGPAGKPGPRGKPGGRGKHHHHSK